MLITWGNSAPSDRRHSDSLYIGEVQYIGVFDEQIIGGRLNANLNLSDRVRRGPDWKWGCQDINGPSNLVELVIELVRGNLGTITHIDSLLARFATGGGSRQVGSGRQQQVSHGESWRRRPRQGDRSQSGRLPQRPRSEAKRISGAEVAKRSPRGLCEAAAILCPIYF